MNFIAFMLCFAAAAAFAISDKSPQFTTWFCALGIANLILAVKEQIIEEIKTTKQ